MLSGLVRVWVARAEVAPPANNCMYDHRNLAIARAEQLAWEERGEPKGAERRAEEHADGRVRHAPTGLSEGRDVAGAVPLEAAPPRNPSTEPPSCRDVAARRATPGRRQSATANLACRQPVRYLRSSRDRGTAAGSSRPLPPDHEAFVDWFVSYWRRRGARVFAERAPDEEAA